MSSESALNNEKLSTFILEETKKAKGNIIFTDEVKKESSKEYCKMLEEFEAFYEGIVMYAKANHLIAREKTDRISIFSFYVVAINNVPIEIGERRIGWTKCTKYFSVPGDKEIIKKDYVIFLDKVRRNEPWENAYKMYEYERTLQQILTDAFYIGYEPFILNFISELKYKSFENENDYY